MMDSLICSRFPGTMPPILPLMTAAAPSFLWPNVSVPTFSGSVVRFCSSVAVLEPSGIDFILPYGMARYYGGL